MSAIGRLPMAGPRTSTNQRAFLSVAAALPDCTPAKLAITINPDLQAALQAYAALYTAEYGIEEPLSELIPPMLAAFLESDRNFSRARSGRIG